MERSGVASEAERFPTRAAGIDRIGGYRFWGCRSKPVFGYLSLRREARDEEKLSGIYRCYEGITRNWLIRKTITSTEFSLAISFFWGEPPWTV